VEDEDPMTYSKCYYQRVSFVLFLFYTPRYICKVWEGGRATQATGCGPRYGSTQVISYFSLEDGGSIGIYLHGVTTQSTNVDIFVVRTSNLIPYSFNDAVSSSE
jgi:hypothetical protein